MDIDLDFFEHGIDGKHAVKVSSIDEFNIVCSYLKDLGCTNFSVNEKNWKDYPYIFAKPWGTVTGGNKYWAEDNYSISFEEWASKWGGDYVLADVKGLENLL